MATRKLDPSMIKYLDEKLKDNGAAQQAIKFKDPRTLVMLVADVMVGIREVGYNEGTLVKLVQETIGVAEKESWCMSFVQTVIAYCELKTGVKSGIYGTEGCTECWEETPKALRVKVVPLPGAVAIWQHGTSWKGHCGFMKTWLDGSNFRGVEGNTEAGFNSTGDIIREGGGVYTTLRDKKANGTMKLRGFLIPFPSLQV